jgi:hypothetical protein
MATTADPWDHHAESVTLKSPLLREQIHLEVRVNYAIWGRFRDPYQISVKDDGTVPVSVVKRGWGMTWSSIDENKAPELEMETLTLYSKW